MRTKSNYFSQDSDPLRSSQVLRLKENTLLFKYSNSKAQHIDMMTDCTHEDHSSNPSGRDSWRIGRSHRVYGEIPCLKCIRSRFGCHLSAYPAMNG